MHSLNKQYIESQQELLYINLLINNQIKVLAIIFRGKLICKALFINRYIVALIVDIKQ